MKKIIFGIVLCSIFSSFAQIKEKSPFITGSLSTTFGINQNYKINEDDNGPFITPKSILLRTAFGYQFDQRWAAALNFGYDHHFTYVINAIPYFATLRYNFISGFSKAYFIETGYGKLWRPSAKFSSGTYFKIGVGLLSISNSRFNGLIRIDYHSKAIPSFEYSRLQSISLGIGVSFL